MKMKNKLLATGCFVMSAACLMAFTACNFENLPAASETFTGVVSEQSYETKNDAAEAFLKAEINGETTSATFVSYEKTADLTAEQIAELNVSETVTAGETGIVTYRTDGSSTISLAALLTADSQSDELTQELKILEIDGAYKYYTPALEEGSNLTKSYLESVFAAENYLNCTLTATNSTTVSATYLGETRAMTVNYSYIFKLTENGAYLNMDITSNAEEAAESMEAYVIKTDTTYGYVMVITDGESYSYTHTTYTPENLWSNIVMLKDHTYFVKTSTGFSVREDRRAQYANEYMSNNASLASIGISSSELACDFYISEGKICKMSDSLSIGGTLQGASYSATANDVLLFTDFGTTTVEIPQSILDYLAEQNITVVD